MALIDIVDAADRVTGTAERDYVHAHGLRHRFVQVLVEGSCGRLLIQQRAAHKAKGPLLFDASVGGHVDSGEGYEAAARREGGEELGLPHDAPYVGEGMITDETPGVENMVGRLYTLRSDGPFTGWEAEADRLEWFAPGELAALVQRLPYLFTGGLKSAVDLYCTKRPEIVVPGR